MQSSRFGVVIRVTMGLITLQLSINTDVKSICMIQKRRLLIRPIRPEVFFKYGLFYPIVFKDAQANQPASYGDRCMQVLGLRSFVSKGFPILFFYVRCQCFSCGSVGVQKNTILNYIKIVKWIPINLLAEYKNKTLVDKCQLFYLHRKT